MRIFWTFLQLERRPSDDNVLNDSEELPEINKNIEFCHFIQIKRVQNEGLPESETFCRSLPQSMGHSLFVWLLSNKRGFECQTYHWPLWAFDTFYSWL